MQLRGGRTSRQITGADGELLHPSPSSPATEEIEAWIDKRREHIGPVQGALFEAVGDIYTAAESMPLDCLIAKLIRPILINQYQPHLSDQLPRRRDCSHLKTAPPPTVRVERRKKRVLHYPQSCFEQRATSYHFSWVSSRSVGISVDSRTARRVRPEMIDQCREETNETSAISARVSFVERRVDR